MVAPNIVARGLGTGLLDGDGFSNTDSWCALPSQMATTFEDVIAEDDKVVTVERLLVHIGRVVWYSADGQAGNIFSRTCWSCRGRQSCRTLGTRWHNVFNAAVRRTTFTTVGLSAQHGNCPCVAAQHNTLERTDGNSSRDYLPSLN